MHVCLQYGGTRDTEKAKHVADDAEAAAKASTDAKTAMKNIAANMNGSSDKGSN